MTQYIIDHRIPNRIDIREGEYGMNYIGYFFKTPGGNWFFQPDPTREITYQQLRRLYNKLYLLNKKK